MAAFFLALFLLLAGPAHAASGTGGPAWDNAPDAMMTVPTVEAPDGGWWTESGVYANVHGGAQDRVVVRRLAQHAATAVPRIAERMGVPAGARIDVYVATDAASFVRIQPAPTPDWADGTAWPRSGLIFLKSPSFRLGTAEPLETVLDHELVHVLLGSAFGARPVPRWLQEGLAQFYSGEIGPQLADQLSDGMFGVGIMGFRQIASGFPAEAMRARMAYAESADLVSWIATTHGEDALRTLIAALARGESLDNATRLATGLGVDGLDSAWRGRMQHSGLWFRGLMNSNVWWGLGAVALGVGWWRRRKRDRERRARWDREEELARLLAEQQALRLSMISSAWRAPGESEPMVH